MTCGGIGHKAKECNQEPFCFRCVKKGHKTDSTLCTEYKKQISEASARIRTKRSLSRNENKNTPN